MVEQCTGSGRLTTPRQPVRSPQIIHQNFPYLRQAQPSWQIVQQSIRFRTPQTAQLLQPNPAATLINKPPQEHLQREFHLQHPQPVKQTDNSDFKHHILRSRGPSLRASILHPNPSLPQLHHARGFDYAQVLEIPFVVFLELKVRLPRPLPGLVQLLEEPTAVLL